jgi:hypothetical protein
MEHRRTGKDRRKATRSGRRAVDPKDFPADGLLEPVGRPPSADGATLAPRDPVEVTKSRKPAK